MEFLRIVIIGIIWTGAGVFRPSSLVLKDCNYWYYLNCYQELCWLYIVLKDCNYWYYLNIAFGCIHCHCVLKDCNYWYYLNKVLRKYVTELVLKDCNSWYYLNLGGGTIGVNVVLKDCNYWYYLNKPWISSLSRQFLRIVIIGIIWTGHDNGVTVR